MTPKAYGSWLLQQLTTNAEDSLEETASDVKQEIHQRIPANRVQTRRAVRLRLKRNGRRREARIGLHFDNRYPIAGTQTERIFRTTWDRVRPSVFTTYHQSLKRRIGELSK